MYSPFHPPWFDHRVIKGCKSLSISYWDFNQPLFKNREYPGQGNQNVLNLQQLTLSCHVFLIMHSLGTNGKMGTTLKKFYSSSLSWLWQGQSECNIL